MGLGFEYKSYQAVRHNLWLSASPILLVAGFFAFFRILPEGHQTALVTLQEVVASNPIWKGVSGAGVLVALAALLIEVLKVHDRYYDKHVIKWRQQYDVDFILTRLLHPLNARPLLRFYEEAARNRSVFMEELYYSYLRDGDLKIPSNLVVRFYEKITVYWLTQFNEVVVASLFFLGIGYWLWGPGDPTYLGRLTQSLVILAAAFVLNRGWVRSARNGVRDATLAEIRAIHEAHNDDLLKRVRKLCKDYGITVNG